MIPDCSCDDIRKFDKLPRKRQPLSKKQPAEIGLQQERDSHDGEFRTYETHGPSAASSRAEACASLVQAEDIITPAMRSDNDGD
jgi:hypothetical protein